MKAAVAIRHVSFEDLGNLAQALAAHEYRIDYKDAGFDSLAEIDPQADLLVILGGPIGAYEEANYPFLSDELALIRRRLDQDLPTLGICLGAQLMARALGARVYPGAAKEIGWKQVSLTEAGRNSPLSAIDRVPVLHWHGDTFDLPDGARLLASTETYINQAFCWGKHALALQFHVEAQQPNLEQWYIGHACEIGAVDSVSVPSLRADTKRFAPQLQRAAQELWNGWLAAIG